LYRFSAPSSEIENISCADDFVCRVVDHRATQSTSKRWSIEHRIFPASAVPTRGHTSTADLSIREGAKPKGATRSGLPISAFGSPSIYS
jgi:hypothetical protein